MQMFKKGITIKQLIKVLKDMPEDKLFCVASDEARIDGNLTYSEQKNQATGILKEMGFDFISYQKDEHKFLMNEQEKEFEKNLKENMSFVVNSKELNDFFKPVYQGVEKIKMGLKPLLMVKGNAGLGKSKSILNALRENNMDFTLISGRITEAHLYQILYENRNKIIWFKDCMKLFHGQYSLEMLKSATENDRNDRIITNHTYSKETKTLPKAFLFEGNIIFDFNQVVDLKYTEDFNALRSRAEYVELVFSFEELSRIMRLIAKTEKEKEITEFLIENYKFVGHNQFNLRTQRDCFTEFEYAEKKGFEWKKQIREFLEKNKSPIQSFLYQIMGNNPIRAVELKKFLIRCGAVQTVRTAERRIESWLEIGELFKVTQEEHNPLVSLCPTEARI